MPYTDPDMSAAFDTSGSYPPFPFERLGVGMSAWSLTGAQIVPVNDGEMLVSAGSENVVALNGELPIDGSLAFTEAQEQVRGEGTPRVTGTTTLTDGAEAVLVAGTTKVPGSLSLTEAEEVLDATGTTDITGSLSLTEAEEEVEGYEEKPPVAVINATVTDALLLDAVLTDTPTLDAQLKD
jgi:hypothetical protein